MPGLIYHIMRPASWSASQAAGHVSAPSLGSEGFIHCSTRQQLAGSVARHYQYDRDLIILAIHAAALGKLLRYDVSRDGDLFPHVYGLIPHSAIRQAYAVSLDTPGMLPDLPDLLG